MALLWLVKEHISLSILEKDECADRSGGGGSGSGFFRYIISPLLLELSTAAEHEKSSLGVRVWLKWPVARFTPYFPFIEEVKKQKTN